MSISALILYGSCARGDDQPDSDVDILAIHTGNYFKHRVERKINISFYSIQEIKEQVSRNSLFALHLFLEGKVLFESEFGFVERLLSGLNESAPREYEIKLAGEVGQFLLRFWDDIENFKFRNARVAWVARTALIVESIKHGDPSFDEKSLLRHAGTDRYKPLISAKSSGKENYKNRILLRQFLDEVTRFNHSNPGKTPEEYIELSENKKDLQSLVGNLIPSAESIGRYSH